MSRREGTKLALLVAVSFLGAVLQAVVHLPSGRFNLLPHRLNWSEIAAFGEHLLLVDAREGDLGGPLPASAPAIRLNEAAWDAGLRRLVDRWTPDSRLVVLCDSPGNRSAESIRRRILRELALPEVFVAIQLVSR